MPSSSPSRSARRAAGRPNRAGAATGERRRVERLAAALQRRAGGSLDAAVVLGSGWEPPHLDHARETPYGRLPGLPHTGVAGHAGQLLTGRRGGLRVAVFRGRVHLYEGRTATEVVRGVRAAAAAGARAVILTNASGGISPRATPGRLVVISDHLHLAGGDAAAEGGEAFGPPFTAMAGAHDAGLRKVARAAARRLRVPCSSGVYACVRGPAFETAAEVRMLGRLGADIVGMSTVPEVLAARRLGLRVLALSLVANRAGRADDDHGSVLARVRREAPRAVRVLEAVLDHVAGDGS